MKHIAIVGFGGAGYCAAEAVRARDPHAKIDVYSDTNAGPYNPMLTTYYVKGSIDYNGMFPFGSLTEIGQKLNLDLHPNIQATSLSPAEKKLTFSDGSEQKFDSILFSTGASAFTPPIQGIELPRVITMRTVSDAVKLKDFISTGRIKKALVIGASWVGIKVVEDFYEHQIDCTLIDGAANIFSTAAFPQTAERIHASLEKKGIHLSFGQFLSCIEKENNGQLTAIMKNGCRFTADIIAVCIGIKTNVAFLKDSGLIINRGILVDSYMRTNFKGIYAAGDCCESPEMQSGLHKHIGLWTNARIQGRIAGINMTGGNEVFTSNILINLAHYMHSDFLSIGDISACTDEDDVYEYENSPLYIRAVKKDNKLKCINILGSSENNGIIRSAFMKPMSQDLIFNDCSRAILLGAGYPESFLDFINAGSCPSA